MKTSDFDFYLPPELIAQIPIKPRDHSRLMVINRQTGQISHDRFFNLPKYLSAEDVVVFNQTKVIPARLYGTKNTGGKVEILLLRPNSDGWNYISKPGLRTGQTIKFTQGLEAMVNNHNLTFNTDNINIPSIIKSIGYTPLPPYIAPQSQIEEAKIRRRYQTVYAKQSGSVAAPTAGFHFTKTLLNKIPNKAFITLHVGLGTFAPIKTEDISLHQMHSELFDIPNQTIKLINKFQRIIAVGTTTVRTLETWASTGNTHGETDIFIYPGFKFLKVGGLITNFHLPKSTLIMLVAAFAGTDLVKKAYLEAISKNYRFYSFGDAMLIL